MHDTLDTIITSSREANAVVAERRRRSSSSFMEASFSIYVSVCGIYASG